MDAIDATLISLAQRRRSRPAPSSAVSGFTRRWPYTASNRELYLHMAGPSEFAIVGTLRDWDVTDRLGEIHVPVLITCGEHDEMRPAHAKDMRRRMPNAELEVFANASHLAMAEVPEAYRARLNQFFDRVERA